MSEVVVKLQKLYPWQRAVLDAPQRHRLLCVSRQGGKTTVCMQAAARDAMAGRSVLWCAPVHKEIIDPFRSLRDTLAPITRHATNNDEIQLLTGGQIRFRSTDDVKNLRGANYFLIVADELAFGKADVYTTVEPMLNRQKGRFLGLSTPNGQSNHFYELWERVQKDPDWYTVRLPYTQCPGLTVEMIEKARELYPTAGAFRQEYEAEFIGVAGGMFDPTWFDDIMVDYFPTTFQRTMMAVDLSLGKDIKSDWQAIDFVGISNQVAYVDCFCERLPMPILLNKIKTIYEMYHPEGISFEANGFQSLAADAFLKLFTVPPPIYQVNNSVNKETRISRLGPWLSRKGIKILNNQGGKQLYRQLCDFPMGDFDDAPDALEMALRTLAR